MGVSLCLCLSVCVCLSVCLSVILSLSLSLYLVNRYKYLGYTLTTKLPSVCACEDFASKAKGKILDLMRTMWSLGSFDTTVLFQLFDAQIKPMLLYASEVWGTSRLANIETAHLFACKRLLSVSDKTPNHMVYGETAQCERSPFAPPPTPHQTLSRI